MNASLLVCALIVGQDSAPRSFLCQPAFALDEALRGPAVRYEPQPGDVFLATGPPANNQYGRILWFGHLVAGTPGVHHSGIFFRRSNKNIGLLEAGPFNTAVVDAVEPYAHIQAHTKRNNLCWIRKRQVPLTKEQSAKLTTFAEAQIKKPFAIGRIVRQVTPFRARGPWTELTPGPQGNRTDWFCSELVTECMSAAGIVNSAVMRPSATYPRDLFFGQSQNSFLNRHLPLNAGWEPPARWVTTSVN